MLRLRAFRPTNEKIVHLELHPTHPWLATADASDNVVVWDWEHRQVVYELNAGGVDTRRLVGAKLQKLAEGETEPKAKITEAIRGGSVKQIKFYDEDVRFWHAWLNRSAAAEAPAAVNQQFASLGGGPQTLRGRHFLVICCENKVIFLDMVTMRSLDVPKQALENKSPLCMEFLPRSAMADGPLVGFGGSDGVIRVLSMASWQLVRKYVGGHKGAVCCMTTFLSSSGEMLLASGASDGLIVLWTADGFHETREMAPKHTIGKAHDGGVYAIELARVLGGAPQLITIGADKTLAVWDTVSFKELKRIKPVAKLACHSVASWCHPRAPALDILTCVKDSHIWAVQHSTYTAITRPLCDLTSQVPASFLAPNKKLKCYCMIVHPLQPHLVATGTNLGVILSEFDAKALPATIAMPTPSGSKEHTAAFIAEKEIRLLSFQLSTPLNSTIGSSVSATDPTRPRHDSSESPQLQVKQTKKRVTNVPHDVYSRVSISKSGKHVAVVWPDVPHFAVYKVADWSIVDSGSAKHFAWDSCNERYALVETTVVPRMPQFTKGRKAKEAAAQAAAAAAAAASAAASATVQVRIILDDGSANQLTRSIEGRAEPVIGLQGGALLGVAYKFPRRMSFSNAAAASAVSAAQAAAFAGVAPTFSSMEDGGGLGRGETPSNFQLYSWETFKPVGGLLPEPDWTAWDPTVEYCALAYQHSIVISALRPQYRYLGSVAIAGATGGIWHRRQLFLATATTIECVFVDAGVTAVDLERKRKKEELKANEAQARAMAEHGELALITVDNVQPVVQERVPLRPPMLQVVRLASFQHTPTIPPFMATPKLPKTEVEDVGVPKEIEEKRSAAEVAVAGGGVSVAISRLPPEQKRPVGPVVVVGVRDGVLWLIDRYMTAHAIGLGHPGIRCRCLAAYGDAISAVKWATRLGREHHDDLAQFMLGMGYATEALHLPGISKRLEFDLALQSNDLKRALQCLLTLSNSRNIGQEMDVANNSTGLLILPSPDINMADAVKGIIKFAKEFLELIDAADATAQKDIAVQALRRLAAAGAIKDALQPHELRALAFRLALHGELTRLGVLVNTMIAAGQGREAAVGAALLGDSTLLEKALEETGMYAEAALHAHAHGRPTIKTVLQSWNQLLQKEAASKRSSSALLQTATQSLPEAAPILQDLTQANRKPLIEIVPPGNVIVNSGQNLGISTMGMSAKGAAMKQNPPPAGQPLMLEGPPPKPLQLEGPQILTPTSEGSVPPPPTSITALQSPTPAAVVSSDSLPGDLTQPVVPNNLQQQPTTNLLPTATSPSAVTLSDPLLSALTQPTVPNQLQQLPTTILPPTTIPSSVVPMANAQSSNTANTAISGPPSMTTENNLPVTSQVQNGTASLAPLVDFLS